MPVVIKKLTEATSNKKLQHNLIAQTGML